jgi:hypothetical protein
MIMECPRCRARFEDGTGMTACPECGSAVSPGGASHGALFDEIRSEVLGEIDPDGIELNPGSASNQGAGPRTGSEAASAATGIAGDGGNWEEFVNISKTGAVTEDFKVSIEDAFKERDSGFNWESLRIDKDRPEPPALEPRLFEDEAPGESESDLFGRGAQPGREAPPEDRREKPSDRRPDSLFLDTDALSQNKYQSASRATEAARPMYDTGRMYRPKPRKSGGAGATFVYALLSLIILAVIFGASYVILFNMGFIPPQMAAQVEGTVKSLIPGMAAEPARDEVAITQHQGRWLDTRNGPLYVISGKITNESDLAVSYVKIQSEFISAGQVLYDETVYAGNTFTEGELRGLPLQDILLKLNKKTGNMDFYNTEKLGGLNFDIKPGESVPFYAVFPPSGKVLGLKYNLRVVDYETSLSD